MLDLWILAHFIRSSLVYDRIAAKRPLNLYQQICDIFDEAKVEGPDSSQLKDSPRRVLRSESRQSSIKAVNFLETLSRLFWSIHSAQPKKTSLANVVQLQEILPLEPTIQYLIEIIHAIMIADAEMIPLGVKSYTNFICTKDQAVALAAKGAILKTLRSRSAGSSSHAAPKPRSKSSERQHKDRTDGPSSAPLLPDLEEGNDGNDSDENEVDETFQIQDANEIGNQNMDDMLGELQMVWQMVEPHLGQEQIDELIQNPESLQQVFDTSFSF